MSAFFVRTCFFYCFTPFTSHLPVRASSRLHDRQNLSLKLKHSWPIRYDKRRRERENAKEKKKKDGLRMREVERDSSQSSSGVRRIADSRFCFSLSLFHFRRVECEDLTLSIRTGDKFNHRAPSTKSWLNRNANNRAPGPLINANHEG